MSTTPTIFWFRRDLRLADDPALVAAVCTGNGDVVPAFVLDATFAAPAGPTRVAFLHATRAALDTSLAGRLAVRAGNPAEELRQLAAGYIAAMVEASSERNEALARFAEARELSTVLS